MRVVVVNVKVTIPDEDERNADDIAQEVLEAVEKDGVTKVVTIEGWRVY